MIIQSDDNLILKTDLKEYLKTFTTKINDRDDGTTLILEDPSNNNYFFISDHDYEDFCRKVSDLTNSVDISVDCNMWLIARLPAKYKKLSCSDIVDTIWGLSDAETILPDSDTQEYAQYCSDEIYDIWQAVKAEDNDPESLGCFLAGVPYNELPRYHQDIKDNIIWKTMINSREHCLA